MLGHESGWRFSRQTNARGVPRLASLVRAGHPDNGLERDAPATFSQILMRGSMKATASAQADQRTPNPHRETELANDFPRASHRRKFQLLSKLADPATLSAR